MFGHHRLWTLMGKSHVTSKSSELSAKEVQSQAESCPHLSAGTKNVNFLHVAKEARKRDHSGNPSADEITEADSCIAST